MSRAARAAQFAPFSALVGLEDTLEEKRRFVNGENEENSNENNESVCPTADD